MKATNVITLVGAVVQYPRAGAARLLAVTAATPAAIRRYGREAPQFFALFCCHQAARGPESSGPLSGRSGHETAGKTG